MRKLFFRALPVAVLALLWLCANLVIAQECHLLACGASESAQGGVPDGVFDNQAAAVTVAPPAPPAVRVDAADEPGAAIFNPFSGAQGREQAPQAGLLPQLLHGNHAAMLAIGLMLALALALAAVAVFLFLRRRNRA